MNLWQVMIFRLYILYNKHKMIKLALKTEKYRKYYLKCSNTFFADCTYCIFFLNNYLFTLTKMNAIKMYVKKWSLLFNKIEVKRIYCRTSRTKFIIAVVLVVILKNILKIRRHNLDFSRKGGDHGRSTDGDTN